MHKTQTSKPSQKNKKIFVYKKRSKQREKERKAYKQKANHAHTKEQKQYDDF